jgi:hypothetical protein
MKAWKFEHPTLDAMKLIGWTFGGNGGVNLVLKRK